MEFNSGFKGLNKTICSLQCFPHTSDHYKPRKNNCCNSGGTSTLEGTFRYLLAKPVEVHQSSGYWRAPSGRGYSTGHVFPVAAASILLRDVLAAGAAPSSTVASVECEKSASPFWRSVCCSKMETKLISQVLSFSISMCVRQMRPIHFSAIFHWHYLTRTMLFSCRCVLTVVWHKHLSIYRMAQKITWHSSVNMGTQGSSDAGDTCIPISVQLGQKRLAVMVKLTIRSVKAYG